MTRTKLIILLWLKSLVAAFIGGAATAGSTWAGLAAAQSAGVDVPQLNWKALGIVLLTAGVTNSLMYLRQSPLPDFGEAGEKPKPVVGLPIDHDGGR